MIANISACRAEKVGVQSLFGHQEMADEIRTTVHATVIQTASTPSLWEAPPSAVTSPGIWRNVPPLWPPPTAVARALGL